MLVARKGDLCDRCFGTRIESIYRALVRRIGIRMDFDNGDIANALSTMRAQYPNLKVFLRADAQTPHRYVNQTMEACAEAGIFDLIFASNKN